ncbi:neprilysin-2-like [Planococcus citri]|uniref:neprilysin-2-like n=1 Tax=Planococcus citri TaxID=170843 RepID=UPI0031F742E7
MLNCRILPLVFILTLTPIIRGSTIPRSINDEPKNEKICRTEGCLLAAEIISSSMDTSVDPCDDFYKFACGGYIINNTIPAFNMKFNSFSNITDIITNQLKEIVEEESNETEIRPFRMVKQFYKDCLKADIITGSALKIIQKKVDLLGGWPQTNETLKINNATWISVLEQSRKIGFRSNYILSLYIDVSHKNATKKHIHIEKPYLRTKVYSLLGMRPDYSTNTYFKMMTNIAMKYKTPYATAIQELTPILQFEIELAKIYEPTFTKAERINNSIVVTVEEAQKRFPSIEWLKTINALLGSSISVEKNETIVIISPKLMDKLQKLLDQTPKKVIINYIIWRHIQESLHFYFIDNVQPKWKNCLAVIQTNLDAALSAMYIRRHFKNGTVKENILEMVQTIRKEQYNILSASDWIDNETRQAALEKAQAVTERVAYPDELLDDDILTRLYQNLNLEPNQYYDNILKISDFRMNLIFSSVREAVNKTDVLSYRYLFLANAFNVFEENSIEIPAVMLQGKFYSIDRPNYMNYGAVGFVIGHELSHAFDSNGHYYDKQGNYINWWQSEMEKKYADRIKCFVDQYNKFIVEDTGENVNGTHTLAENISDNEGVRTAYLAYKAWAREHGPEEKLPGLDYTPEQMFWISAANSWCAKYTFLYMIETLSKDVHAPDKIRILGAFANQEDFANDFKCAVNSTMNPLQKCTLW